MDPKYYFNQFWAFENPDILTYDTLRNALYDKWEALWNDCPNVEDKPRLVAQAFKQSLLKGNKR
jgi:hypothetical protein